MSFKKKLFGKKITLIDDFFGRIESNRTRSDAAESLTWCFNIKIANFRDETFVIADGNYLGINSRFKSSLKDFIVNFEQKYSLEIDKLIASDDKYLEFKNWKTTHFISLVVQTEDSNDSFDFDIESYDNEDDRFSIEFINQKLQNMEIAKK